MQFKHLQTIQQSTASEGIVKVTALCWSPNGKRLAVCTTDRVVLMFDEDGVKKDKFATKAADKGPKNYVVSQMAFSPGSDKLAIAQSDFMVFVYKLGAEWGDKKSICNKFQHSSPITTLVWPTKRVNEVIYGLADGQVKIGDMKTHKPMTLYQTESYVTAMSPNPDGTAVAIAHLDGSIYTYSFETPERGARVIIRHSSIPFALCWGTSLVVAGNDAQVSFYDEDGGAEEVFEYTSTPDCREFTVAVSNPTGDAVVVGNFNGFYVYNRNKDSGIWEDIGFSKVENLYSVSALGWKPDGDKLVAGNVCGVVDMFDVCVKRSLYKGGFEMTYVSHSQVIVRHVETNARIVVRSQFGFEITKTNIYKSKYVVATTSNTLLLGDLDSLKLSEIQWHGNGTEKFIFDNPSACIIYFAGEISLVEYGLNELLGSIRTSNISSHVLSLRVNERRKGAVDDRHAEDNKKIAFLLDAQTVCVKDLVMQTSVLINHDAKIDWLELNGRADMILFRDKRRFLYVFDLETQKRDQLLSYCTYVQWVPQSDVVVAQNRSNLCVWYNIQAPDRVTLHAIKGDIEEIERGDGKTEVIVDEGMTQAVYPLDEPLIEFGTAIDDKDFPKAMEILERLELSPEAEAMWQQLCTLSIQSGELIIAQRCAAATSNVALSKFLTEINEERLRLEQDQEEVNSINHYSVRAKLALLDKDLRLAEDELLSQGKVDECIAMYQNVFKYEAAIRVAEQNRHSDAATMRQEYFQYLLDTNQEEKAAGLKEKEGEFIQAINLYIKGGMPAKAAEVITSNDMNPNVQILESVASALVRAGLHDIAGDFFDRLQESQKALDSYVRGHAFKKAVELARRSYPGKVVDLQEQWGDYLVSQKQIDMAINHYIEAKNNQKAIEAAIYARQHSRALQLLDVLDSQSSKPYYMKLAAYYEENSQFDLAEKCYISADEAALAVEMHTRLGHWEIAHKIATSYLPKGEVGLLYINQAQKFITQGRLREAEKMYLAVDEKDLAINMYKKARRFDDMIRLVQQLRPDLLKETHQFLGQSFEIEGNLKDAEHHYVEGSEWQSAVNMYRSNDQWDDAIRVAKFYGGIAACKRVSISLLVAVGVPEGAKVLAKHSLVETAIDNAAESGAYDIAFDLAGVAMPKKLTDIHLKYALFLEDEEKFKEAEAEFIKAGKPKEAIDMWVHQLDWPSAIRVAEAYDPVSVPDVLVAQARSKAESRDFKAAEELFVTAAHPEMALAMYQEADMWPEALKLAQMHLPHRVAEINASFKTNQTRAGKGGGSKSDYLSTGKTFEQTKQWQQAIDTYLSARKDRLDSATDLEQIWSRAMDIARNHLPNKMVEVALEISKRLIEINKDEAAADVLFDVGRHDEAIDICIDAKAFDKARSLAQGNPTLWKRVDEAYQGHLIANENAGELQKIGKADVALDVLAKKGEWDKLWEAAAKDGKSTASLGKYVIMQIEELLRGKSTRKVDDAVRVLSKRQGPVTDDALTVYSRLTRSVLSRSYQEDKDPEYAGIIGTLREVLFKLASQYRLRGDKKITAEVVEVLMAVHYQHMMFVTRASGLKDISAKCAMNLLKYPEFIPQDKAFYIAGVCAREQGNTNLAFLLLNRYVDITEAIDNSDPSFVDNSQFEEADAIPLSGPLPPSHYLHDEDMREEVRTWVLSVVTDSNVEQRLKPRNQSKGTLYEGLYSSERPTCIVTGFPVHPADMLEVNNSVANRKDWNALVAKTHVCPWTGQSQNPLY